MVKIKNLTPHPITLIVGEGDEIIEIQPAEKPARLEEKIEDAGFILASTTMGKIKVPLIKKSLGKLIGLPEPEIGKIFVVSLPVALAAQRKDVFAIGESVRDEKGNIVGAKSLAMF